MNRIKIIIFLNLLFFAPLFIKAQKADARIDTNSILIGDQINLDISFTTSVKNKILWPLLNDTISENIEIIEKSKIDSLLSDDKHLLTLKQKILITSFDSGNFVIPPIRFNFKKPGDNISHFKESNPLMLKVNTIAVDTTKNIMPIKSPIEAPVSFMEVLPWIIAALAFALILFLIIYFIRKRKKNEPLLQIRKKPKRPAHEIALKSLENLKEKKLWQKGMIKKYHSELTEIIRIYFDNRFNIHAVEMTSDEILKEVNNIDISDELKDNIKNMLILADLVKFAKEKPLPSDQELSLNNAIIFVKNTIIKVENNKQTEKKNKNIIENNKKPI